MNILEKSRRLLELPICDNCLGRQFGQLLSGFGNDERGRMLRNIAGMSIDKDKLDAEDVKMELSNFTGMKFHILDTQIAKIPDVRKLCAVCGGFFENELEKTCEKIIETARKIGFNTFTIGTKLSAKMLEAEESMWEHAGIDWCEPLKAEVNRELGKRIEKKLKKNFSGSPDVVFLYDMSSGKIITDVNPLFLYGEYQKLVRGMPQTKWPSGKYKTSVEQIIAKPVMPATKGASHAFHGMGREDIDARCLAWRPFVLEIKTPRKRKLDMTKMMRLINKDRRIRVRKLRLSGISEVRKIKEIRADKSYKAIIVCENKIDRKLLKNAVSLQTEIKQRTPKRVLHRRADLKRKRHVKKISIRILGPKKLLLTVTTDAGLYVKELVSGDEGRTRPNLSEVLNNKCTCTELDVMKIMVPKSADRKGL